MTSQNSRTSRVLSELFRPFSKVKPAEAVVVSVMTLSAFLLLTAYYLLKTPAPVSA